MSTAKFCPKSKELFVIVDGVCGEYPGEGFERDGLGGISGLGVEKRVLAERASWEIVGMCIFWFIMGVLG